MEEHAPIPSMHQKDRGTYFKTLRALGFCGIDESVHPNILGLISQSYPLVEWGVLFRPDKEGTPRYASPVWLRRLAHVASKIPEMKLAAHLCGSRVNEVLMGNDSFVSTLLGLGFRRVQINATAVNGVDTSRLEESVPALLQITNKYPDLEFILQKNDETRPLWQGVLNYFGGEAFPKNVSMLVDESKGTGVISTDPWPSPPAEFEIGYAGGIGPHNIHKVLVDVKQAASGRSVWIDMESSLRSVKNGKDVFDLDKVYEVILAVCEEGMMRHPTALA